MLRSRISEFEVAQRCKITVIATVRIHVIHDMFRSLMTKELVRIDINLNFNRRLGIDLKYSR